MTTNPKAKPAQDGIDIEAALARIGGDETLRFTVDDGGRTMQLSMAVPKPKRAVAIFGNGGALRLANDLEALRVAASSRLAAGA